MAGNVAQWTAPPAAPSGAPLPSVCGARRTYAALYGASWADPAKYLQPSDWACFPRVLRDDTIGFRVVREH